VLEVVRDPINDLVSVSAEIIGGHVAERLFVLCHMKKQISSWNAGVSSRSERQHKAPVVNPGFESSV
jgi:hypothetical protein